MVGKENGKEKKNKKNFWDSFRITFLSICFQRKRSKEPNGWIMFYFGVEPMKISRPSIDAEVALAQVLEGCCLLHKENMIVAH